MEYSLLCFAVSCDYLVPEYDRATLQWAIPCKGSPKAEGIAKVVLGPLGRKITEGSQSVWPFGGAPWGWSRTCVASSAVEHLCSHPFLFKIFSKCLCSINLIYVPAVSGLF